MNGKSLTHDGGESYCGIGSTKQPNKSGKTPAEAVEKRPQTKENTQQPNLGHLSRKLCLTRCSALPTNSTIQSWMCVKPEKIVN